MSTNLCTIIIALGLGLALVGCSSEEAPQPPAPAEQTQAQQPPSQQPPVQQPPGQQPPVQQPPGQQSPTAPQTGGVMCPGGQSMDPPAQQLRPPQPGNTPQARQAHLAALSALMPAYPASATLRVHAGNLALRLPPEGNPAQAQQYFEEALRLHQAGCRLSEGNEWEANEGLGLAHMFQNNFAAALPLFQQGSTRWPMIPQTQYNLACAHCRLNQLEPCYQAFTRALQTAAAGQRPSFLPRIGTAQHYADISSRDPDLAPLRADPRYATAVAPYQRSPQSL